MIHLKDVVFKNLPENSLTGEDVFVNKRVVVFGLPGAFTPTCSSQQVPTFDEYYNDIIGHNIDEIYCVSVNDGFVMKAWFKDLGVERVKYLADGSGEFTRRMGMLVKKDNVGFGMRSWRYAAIINNGNIEVLMAEDGFQDDCELDPYENSSPVKILKYLEDYDRSN